VTRLAYFRVGQREGLGLAVALLSELFGVCSPASSVAAANPILQPGATNEIALRDFLRLVIERNESLHGRILEFEITQKRLKAEQGAFEPEWVLSYDRVENKRENTAEQRRSSGVVQFNEKNNLYNAGLEALVPTGAKIRLGYSLRDLQNNLQNPTIGTIVSNSIRGEFQTFVGLSLTQPVLKNAWFTATLANIRLAALASDVAYQEYRRQMMVIISTAEASYWNLYMAQQQVRFFQESVRLAEALVADNQTRVQAGKGAELEVLEAKAGLALRESKLAEAEQKYYETASQLLSLLSFSTPGASTLIRALDQPGTVIEIPSFPESGQTALDLNPDYLSQLKKARQEDIRVAYVKNQRLPELDLKASYGLNGLGSDPGSSWEDIEMRGFPSFSAGIELRVPFTGGIKGRRELEAARLRKEQALVLLKETETQVLNAIEAALRKVESSARSARNYYNVVAFNETLLQTEMARLEAGKVSSRRVLEVDASLFEARNAVVEANVQYERARLELELVQGSLLRSRNLDLPQKDLERRTATLLRASGLTSRHLDDFSRELGVAYQTRSPAGSMSAPESPSQPGSPAPPRPADVNKGLKLLRDSLNTPDNAQPAK
jgi:outer membrane protein TolC